MKGVRKTTALVLAALMLFLVPAAALRICHTGAAAGDKVIRVGFCQAEKYYEFDYMLYYIAAALGESGDMTDLDLGGLSQESPAAQVWAALSKASCPWAEFVKDGYIDYSDPEFARMSEEELETAIGDRIRSQKLDLVITMGTSGGLMVKDCSNVEYMNFLASDPVEAGIVDDVEYSAISRGWAHVSPGVTANALSVMADIFSPTKVGFIYDMDDPEAIYYSEAATVEEYGKERGYTMQYESVSDVFDDTEEGYEQYYRDVLEAHEKLAQSGIDLYVLSSTLLDPEDMRSALEPFIRNGIPVFSINSSEDVRYGAMASVELTDYQNVGRFGASSLREYAQGTQLNHILQRWDTAPFMVLNIDVMHDTGIKLPLELFLSTNKFYRDDTEDE